MVNAMRIGHAHISITAARGLKCLQWGHSLVSPAATYHWGVAWLQTSLFVDDGNFAKFTTAS